MKQGRIRTIQICLSDIPADKIIITGNKKQYVSLVIQDLYEPNNRDQDTVVSIYRTKEEQAALQPRVWIGGGIIHDNV